MGTTTEIGITEFIENMLKEYIDYLPIEAIFKLWVIHEYNLGKTNKEIKKSIERLATDNKLRTIHSKTALDAQKNLFFASDANKINALKKNTCIWQLLSVINTKNFIKAILSKYPYPAIVGFPFNEWTGKRLHKYIRLYFYMPSFKKRQKLGIELPKVNYLNRLLSPSQKNIVNCVYLLEDILRYYIEKTENPEFFYMYCKKQTYPRSEKDKLAPQKKRRYNTTFFSTFYYLTDKYDYFNDVDCMSYNSKVAHAPILDYIADYDYVAKEHLKRHNLNRNPQNVIFIVNRTKFKRDFIRCHNELTSIPKFKLILIDDLQELKNAIDSIHDSYIQLLSESNEQFVSLWRDKLESLEFNINTVEERIDAFSKLKMNSRAEKDDYLKNAKKITRTRQKI